MKQTNGATSAPLTQPMLFRNTTTSARFAAGFKAFFAIGVASFVLID
jgi:hypothetical protein